LRRMIVLILHAHHAASGAVGERDAVLLKINQEKRRRKVVKHLRQPQLTVLIDASTGWK